MNAAAAAMLARRRAAGRSPAPAHSPSPPPSRALRAAAAAALVIVATGCGYQLGYIATPDAQTIGVPIFENSTFGLRREIEYELTSLVRREILLRTGLRVVDSADADLVLRGNIVQFRETLVVSGDQASKIESNIEAVVDVVLEDRIHSTRTSRRVTGREPFSEAVGQTFESVENRALANLAERVVAAIEHWVDEAAPAPAASSGDGEPRPATDEGGSGS